jgi:signal transduction histidine kinase
VVPVEIAGESAFIQEETASTRKGTSNGVGDDTRSRSYCLLLLSRVDVNRDELLDAATTYGIKEDVRALLEYLDTRGETRAETLAATIEAAFARADREQRRREQAEQLQRQNERLERFASIVSHDLRNPLHVAATRAALARDEHDSEHLASLEDALERMEAIIDDTLSLARKGKTVEETEPVSLRRIALQSWDQVETGGASLEAVGDEVVQADPDRLRSVFENLFRNAVEHGPTSPASQARQDAVEHGVDGEPDDLGVRVGHLPGGFYVEDTGQGIPAEGRRDVFDLGYSSDEDGTGFGLAIVKEIVE